MNLDYLVDNIPVLEEFSFTNKETGCSTSFPGQITNWTESKYDL